MRHEFAQLLKDSGILSRALSLESLAGDGVEREYVFFGKLTDPEQLKKAVRFEDQEQWRILVPCNEDGREMSVRLRKTTTFELASNDIDYDARDPVYTLTIKTFVKGEPGTIEAEGEIGEGGGAALLPVFAAMGDGMIKRRYFFPVKETLHPSGSWVDAWEVDVYGEFTDQSWKSWQPNGWVKLDLEVKAYDLELTDSSFEYAFPVDLEQVVYEQPHNRSKAASIKVKHIIDTYMKAKR